MWLGGLVRPSRVGASVALAAAIVGGCGSVAFADGSVAVDGSFPTRWSTAVDERFGKIMTGGQGIIRSSRALGTFAINSVDYKLALLKSHIKQLKPGRQQQNSPSGAIGSSTSNDDVVAKIHERSAQRLLRLCETNRGVYIKAGQFVATLHQLPREYRSTLAVLQDQARGRPFRVIDKIFKAEFGKSAKEIFEYFEEVPIAAASLAQVHRARLKDGREVAVKVQYPGLKRQVETDIVTMAILSRAVSWFFPGYELSWMLPQFKENLSQQLDFEREGRNAQLTAANFRHKPEVKIPNVHWDLTTKRVLTMEFMYGCKIDDVDAIKAQGLNPLKVASLLVEVFGEMVFCHGHLHGDPHPGNVLVRRSATRHASGRDFELVLLDHGLYRDLDERFRLNFCRLWRALILCDNKAVEAMGRVLGVGDYSKYLPALFTGRSFSSKVEWGQRMPKEEERALKRQVNLAELSTVVENLPDDLFLVLRTDNLIRQHLVKLGATPKLRLITNGKLAVQGLAWRHTHRLPPQQQQQQHEEGDAVTTMLSWARQLQADIDTAHLMARIYAWELMMAVRRLLRETEACLSNMERAVWESIAQTLAWLWRGGRGGGPPGPSQQTGSVSEGAHDLVSVTASL